MKLVAYILVLSLSVVTSDASFNSLDSSVCFLSDSLRQEIESYRGVAERIINTLVDGRLKGRTWSTLQKFVDRFGPRISGSQSLENAIDFMLDTLNRYGLDNVHGEEVDVPHWVRGNESAMLLLPRVKPMSMLGLGLSVGTPPQGITAPVLVVSSFKELTLKAHMARGKIVVFNEEYRDYGRAVEYRLMGASRAARYGAVAVLVRSVTPFSIYSPHTGMMNYEKGIKRIPAAAITIEDAQMMHRMQLQGEKIVVNLRMSARTLPQSKSRNTVADITGRTNPDELVIISGHLDSWDVGQGAMDDGGGAFISWNAALSLRDLGLRPKRTVRTVLWTAEEMGYVGAQAYFKAHPDTGSVSLAMESDLGTFQPLGLSFRGSHQSRCILQEVVKLLDSINATQVVLDDEPGPDISLWTKVGVPSAGLLNKNEHYFWYHHSNADTMTVLDPGSLDKCTAVWAVVSYVVADLSIKMPRYKAVSNNELYYYVP